jgi:hypothetical protein
MTSMSGVTWLIQGKLGCLQVCRFDVDGEEMVCQDDGFVVAIAISEGPPAHRRTTGALRW